MRRQSLIQLALPWLMLLAFPVSAQASELPRGLIRLDPYPAPTLSLHDLDGEPYTLENRRGSIVFVHFWASWCGPCRKEMPAIQRMWDKLQDEGLEIALINTALIEASSMLVSTAAPQRVRPFASLIWM